MADYAELEKRILHGHSHTPKITKGVYNVGGTVTGRMSYNNGPVPWQTNSPKSFGGAMADIAAKMKKDFFGESMCGDCIAVKICGGHDPKVNERRKCQLCGTTWPGLESDNDRRGAILAQRTRTSERKSPTKK